MLKDEVTYNDKSDPLNAVTQVFSERARKITIKAYFSLRITDTSILKLPEMNFQSIFCD